MGLISIYCILNVRFEYDDYVEILFILSSRVVTSHVNLKSGQMWRKFVIWVSRCKAFRLQIQCETLPNIVQ